MDARCSSRKACTLATVMLLMVVLPGCHGTDYTVGGAGGSWSIPTASNINYTMWALWNTYFVGDALYFRYTKGEHSVLEVNFRDYQTCRNASPMAAYTDGNSLVTLNRDGPYYFICGIGDHCNLGQKFDIDVGDAEHELPSPQPKAEAPGAPYCGGGVAINPSGEEAGYSRSLASPRAPWLLLQAEAIVGMTIATFL